MLKEGFWNRLLVKNPSFDRKRMFFDFFFQFVSYRFIDYHGKITDFCTGS
ncbi:hypothetical protein LEP1GSC150_0547 [Leptospira interrogans serovar Copenhageni str. LT2050]|uniref:Uncharacterized protein n=1 Tax=Leptospira interrogans serovar Copenhageni str. LT2050 TaxID=1001598 RepID=M3HCH1_LEPIT|nr:hypothetical protein LEP1GSC150_0547 [Leptospira interrogans serovar Copenhageni str. LT2050]